MQKNTKGHGLGGAAVVTIIVAVLALLMGGVFLFACFDLDMTSWLGIGIMLVYVLGAFAVAVGVVVAMIQRVKEVQGGEEDEAKRY